MSATIFEQASGGKAARILAFLLERKGYQTQALITDLLEQPKYPSERHGIVLISNPDGTRVIIDPVYKLFLRHVGLEAKFLPTDNFLILGEGEVLNTAINLAELVLSHVSRAPLATKRQLVEFFCEIYDLSRYVPVGRGLDHDIGRFKSDPASVSVGTQRMIAFLSSQGAC